MGTYHTLAWAAHLPYAARLRLIALRALVHMGQPDRLTLAPMEGP